MTADTGTIVVGGSAAGLATAAVLQEAGRPYEVLEATDVIGTAWRHHYDRLHLHTPRSSSALPGLPMAADLPRYPARDDVVAYLDAYRTHFGIEPRYGQAVTLLERVDGLWEATTADRVWRAPSVVVATGANRVPVRPTWPGLSDYTGEVLHSGEYRTGEPWRGRAVLVVGFGNSACEQAIDLVEHGAHPHLAVRSAVNVVPRDMFGVVPVLQLGILMRHLPPRLADALAAPVVRLTVGDLGAAGLTRLPYGPNTQIARDRHIPLLDIGTMKHIRAGRMTVHGDVARFTNDAVVFTDGTRVVVDAVVLATGYRPGLADFLVDADAVCDAQGVPLVSGGPTALPGLYFCGQYVSPAGMLREIGIEARRIAEHLSAA